MADAALKHEERSVAGTLSGRTMLFMGPFVLLKSPGLQSMQ